MSPNVSQVANNLRNNILARNLYNPTNVYAINNQSLTNTINTMSTLGLDVGNGQLTQFLDRTTELTPLTKIANAELAILMARRVGQSLLNKLTPNVNVNALFNKNSGSAFITVPADYTITSDLAQQTTVEQIIGSIQGAAGLYNPPSALNASNVVPGDINYYNLLGKGQLNQLQAQIGYNNYGVLGQPKINQSKINPTYLQVGNINVFLDGRTLSADNGYTYFNTSVDKTTFDGLSYNRTNGPVGSIDATLSTGVAAKKAIGLDAQSFQFGQSVIDVNTTTSEPINYSDVALNQKVIWGLTTDEELSDTFNAKQGLLYYTQQIVQSSVGGGLDMTATTFKQGGILMYKNNACRNWTVTNPYNSLAKAIRSAGNGVDFSVLKDSVIPRIFPSPDDTDSERRALMFSIENLAITSQDMTNLGINKGDCEYGPNGGMLCWFPPYDIRFNENVGIDLDQTKFIGRIEPFFTYSSTVRRANLSFKLLVDYPNIVDTGQIQNLSAFFAGCENAGVFSLMTPSPNTAAAGSTIPGQSAGQTPAQPETNSDSINPPQNITYFFPNDVDSVVYPAVYEASAGTSDPNNLYALNAPYNSNRTEMVNFLSSTDNIYCNYTITGYASQLANNDYNMQLSFRRAYNMMNNACAAAGITPTPPDNFYDQSFQYKIVNGATYPITAADFGQLTFVFTYIPSNNSSPAASQSPITFTLVGNGEEDPGVSTALGATEGSINAQTVKQARKAAFTADRNSVTKTAQSAGSTPIPTGTQIANSRANQSQQDSVSISQGNPCYPFQKLKLDFNLLNAKPEQMSKIFRSTYHSGTPLDMLKRLTFLHSCTRPGASLTTQSNPSTNSIFGRMPVSILRLGDQLYHKILIDSIEFDFAEAAWDMNAQDGAGMTYMSCDVNMSFIILGGSSLQTPISTIQNAPAQNFYPTSTYYGANFRNGVPQAAADAQTQVNNQVAPTPNSGG